MARHEWHGDNARSVLGAGEAGRAIRQFHVLLKSDCGISRSMTQLRKSRPLALKVGLLFVPLLLAACSTDESAPVPGEMPEQAREFSDEDKQAALALSVGNVQALSAEMSAYNRALSCSIALDSVHAQLSEGGQLDPAMLNAIEQVRTVYNNRVRQLGSAENMSLADIAADRLQRAEEMTEPSERGQVAIGCLRAMS